MYFAHVCRLIRCAQRSDWNFECREMSCNTGISTLTTAWNFTSSKLSKTLGVPVEVMKSGFSSAIQRLPQVQIHNSCIRRLAVAQLWKTNHHAALDVLGSSTFCEDLQNVAYHGSRGQRS